MNRINAVRTVFAVVTLIFIFGVSAMSLIITPDDYFYYENRARSPIPLPTVADILDGSFAEAFEDGFSDRIAGRQTVIEWKTAAELFLLGKPVAAGQLTSEADENGVRVLLDFHGYYKWDVSYMTAAAAERAAAVAQYRDFVEGDSIGGRFYYVGVPQQFSYFASLYPSWADDREWNVGAMRDSFTSALKNESVSFIDGGAALTEAGHLTKYYAATDHHYTLEGAAVVVDAVLAEIERDTGIPMYYSSGFTFTELDKPMLGSRSRKLFGLWKSPDKAAIARPADDIPFTRTDDGVSVEPTVYRLPADSDKYVLYGVYMGGDIAETVISTNRPDLPDALIFGDSFTNAAECLLWASFDETRCIDLRYYTAATLTEYTARYQPDVVICIRDETVYLASDGNGNLQ